MSGLLSVLSNQYRDRTGVIEKYKSEAQYNLLNWQKCSNEMIELYNKYQKLADEYKELKERMECKENCEERENFLSGLCTCSCNY